LTLRKLTIIWILENKHYKIRIGYENVVVHQFTLSQRNTVAIVIQSLKQIPTLTVSLSLSLEEEMT